MVNKLEEYINYTCALCLVIIVLVGFISFFTEPIGTLPLGEDSISSITVTVFAAGVLILWLYYQHVPILPRFICAVSLPVFGISFHEMFWHIGLSITWGEWAYPKLIFWILYTIAIGVGTYVLDIKYNIITLNDKGLWKLVVGLLLVYVAGWSVMYPPEFYRRLLEYERGFGPDPHSLILYGVATIGRMCWSLLAIRPRSDKK